MSEQQINVTVQRLRDNLNELKLTKSERDNVQDLFIVMVQAYSVHIETLQNQLKALAKKTVEK